MIHGQKKLLFFDFEKYLFNKTIIKDLLAFVTSKDKKIFKLLLQNYTYEEIAEEFSCTSKNIRAKVTRCIKNFKAEFARHEKGLPPTKHIPKLTQYHMAIDAYKKDLSLDLVVSLGISYDIAAKALVQHTKRMEKYVVNTNKMKEKQIKTTNKKTNRKKVSATQPIWTRMNTILAISKSFSSGMLCKDFRHAIKLIENLVINLKTENCPETIINACSLALFLPTAKNFFQDELSTSILIPKHLLQMLSIPHTRSAFRKLGKYQRTGPGRLLFGPYELRAYLDVVCNKSNVNLNDFALSTLGRPTRSRESILEWNFAKKLIRWANRRTP